MPTPVSEMEFYDQGFVFILVWFAASQTKHRLFDLNLTRTLSSSTLIVDVWKHYYLRSCLPDLTEVGEDFNDTSMLGLTSAIGQKSNGNTDTP